MECYYRSTPENRGDIKRMFKIWQERGLFMTTEQRLADQVRVIKRNELLTKIEREEIQRRVDRHVEVSHNEQQQEGQEEIRHHQRQGMADPTSDL